jgi:(1->4)-alpha-D-glucan 1-alpha-D-glucosylmutase
MEESERVESSEEKKFLPEEIERAFSSVIDKLSRFKRIPAATYRLQFNHQFKFSDAKDIVSYLHELGISDIYASPYFKAQKGSLHGYDILDHNQLNPEVGTAGEYDQLIEELRARGMGQVLDIVPNHMSIASDENLWWTDVLENGPSSIYSSFFDIDWKPVKDELEDKVLLPILGDQYGNVLENQELRLGFEQGAFFIDYYDRKLPIAPASYTKILKYAIEELEGKIGKEDLHFQEFLSILTALDHLPPRTEKKREKVEERRREKEVIKRRLQNLYVESQEVRSFIDRNVLIFNGEKGSPKSFELLDDLLNDQVYRLSHWRVAMEEINYRRFFDINELAAIRMENSIVFQEANRLIFQLIREGKVTGLRVDHIDGLNHPLEYLCRLQKGSFVQFFRRFEPVFGESVQEEIGRVYDKEISQNSFLQMPLYVVGEKILIRGERMPEGWPLFGTTGYGFLNSLNGIFIEMENAKAFEGLYSRFIRSKMNYQDLVYEKKKLIMEVSMSGEVNGLGHYLNRLSEKNRHTRDFTLRSLTTAIVETIACFPVYRSYVGPDGVDERDRRYIEQAVSRAKRKNPAMSATTFDFLQRVLLLQYPDNSQEADKMEWLDFVMRFQQVTGPVMAKGLEDTVFYIYNRFVSMNEVGGNPEWFGTPLETFHGQNIERTKNWPHSFLATSTHDTKRSEDVRARINVLSEIPDEWREHVTRWTRMNSKHKTMVDGQWAPDRNEEYLLYQTLVGTWPIRSISQAEYEILRQRMKDYMIKATREAKVNTSWISPNLLYEEGLLKFIEAILSPSLHNHFLWDLETFQKKISRFGMFNSLSQTLLKITSPGVPDFYQGTEIWDFSLVDPDNRRPVDYSVRKALFQELKRKMEGYGPDLSVFLQGLLQNWKEGAIKLYLIYRALNYRRRHPSLFMEGTYLPIISEGTKKDHVCAFARQKGEGCVLVVVPRFLTRLVKTEEEPLGDQVWTDTRLVVPEGVTGEQFLNVFTDEMIQTQIQERKKRIYLRHIFKTFPVAMLEAIGESK